MKLWYKIGSKSEFCDLQLEVCDTKLGSEFEECYTKHGPELVSEHG